MLIRCNQTGVAYVAFSQWIAVIIIYTVVYHMLEPPEEYYEYVSDDGEEGEVKEVNDTNSMPSVTAAEWPDVKNAVNDDTRTPLLARVFRYPSLTSQLSRSKYGRSIYVSVFLLLQNERKILTPPSLVNSRTLKRTCFIPVSVIFVLS